MTLIQQHDYNKALPKRNTMKHFLLNSESLQLNVRMKPLNNICVNLISGKELEKEYDPETLPFEFEMLVRKDIDTGEEKAPTLYDFYSNVPIVSTRFLTIFKNIGVDTVEVFKTQVYWRNQQRTLHNYHVINVTEMIDCAVPTEKYNCALADIEDGMLTIDPSKTNNTPLFRLAKCETHIVVNEVLANAIIAEKLSGVILTPIFQV